MTQVRVVHASMHRGDEGTVIGPATQAGMDVCVDFGSGDFAEFRWWELCRLGPGHLQDQEERE